MNIQFQNL